MYSKSFALFPHYSPSFAVFIRSSSSLIRSAKNEHKMPIFQPKHQKLILQCYPPGRGFDKKPNSSELSYLLYYASTRRVKLEKVGKFLQKKNAVDISRNRTGNVQVTLEIINSLIKKCPDDLNVFAHNVNAILASVLTTNDLGLCQHGEAVFDNFCSNLDGELFTGDIEFVDNFTKLAEGFVGVGINAPQTNSTQWKGIGLNAAKDLARCKNISQGNGNYIVKKVIPFVVNEIHDDFSKDQLQSEVRSHASEHELSRYNTARSNVAKNEASTPTEIATDELAINALKSFFNSSSSSQLVSCTKAICHYLVSSNVDRDWAAVLVEMVTNWVPVQLRFVILGVLTSHLNKKGKVPEQLIYLHTISSLLSSSVNMVGLSVIDILRQMIELQTHLITDSEIDAQQLIYAYSEAISSLSTHIYYQNQIIDTVSELLFRIKDFMLKTTQKNQVNPGKLKNFILVMFDNIKNVLITANTNSTVQRTTVPFDFFQDSFDLLSYDNKVLYNETDLFKIQSKYIDVLITVLRLEYSNSQDSEEEDHESLISNAKASALNEFYEDLEQVTKIENYGNYDSLIVLMGLVVEKFGINAIVNLFPFFFEWQLKDTKLEDPSLIYKDNIGYLLSFFASTYLKDDEFKNQVLSRIDYRKSNGLWKISSEIPVEKSSTSPNFIFTKEDAASYIQNNLSEKYHDLVFNSHYIYQANNSPSEEVEEDLNDQDTSFFSQNGAPNLSFSQFPQPGENHSIRSAPLSARSLLNGKLHVPKVQELRKAISGTALKQSNYANASKQKTDIGSLLNELKLESTLDDRGSLGFRY